VDTQVKQIDELLPSIVRQCRLGDYGDAAGGLNRFIAAVQSMQKSAECAAVPKAVTDKFNYSLETVLLMLQNKDWVAVADVIEYELIPLWQLVRNRFSSPMRAA
jgi:hypothetical protein